MPRCSRNSVASRSACAVLPGLPRLRQGPPRAHRLHAMPRQAAGPRARRGSARRPAVWKLPSPSPVAVARSQAVHRMPRGAANAACRCAWLCRLPPRPRGQRRRGPGLRELPREATAAAAHRRRRANHRPSRVHRLPRAAQLRGSAGQAVRGVPRRSAGARSQGARAVHRVPRAARRCAARLHELPRQAGRPSGDGPDQRSRCARVRQAVRRMPSSTRGRTRPDREGRGLCELSSDDLARDGALPRLPSPPRWQAATDGCDLRALPRRSLAIDDGHRPRRLRHVPRSARAQARREPDLLRQLPCGSRGHIESYRPRGVRQLPHQREPRSPDAAGGMCDLPPPRGKHRGERPPGVRELSRPARASAETSELRQLSRRKGPNTARPRARLRQLPPPARPHRPRESPHVRELPLEADAARAPPRRESCDLLDLPRAA